MAPAQPTPPPPKPRPTVRSPAAPSRPTSVADTGGTTKVYESVSRRSLKTGKAMTAHAAGGPGELSFAAGEIVVQLAAADDAGMAKGMLMSGTVGTFPLDKLE